MADQKIDPGLAKRLQWRDGDVKKVGDEELTDEDKRILEAMTTPDTRSKKQILLDKLDKIRKR